MAIETTTKGVKMEVFTEHLAEALWNLAESGSCGARAIVRNKDGVVTADFFDGLVVELKADGTWSWSKRK